MQEERLKLQLRFHSLPSGSAKKRGSLRTIRQCGTHSVAPIARKHHHSDTPRSRKGGLVFHSIGSSSQHSKEFGYAQQNSIPTSRVDEGLHGWVLYFGKCVRLRPIEQPQGAHCGPPPLAYFSFEKLIIEQSAVLSAKFAVQEQFSKTGHVGHRKRLSFMTVQIVRLKGAISDRYFIVFAHLVLNLVSCSVGAQLYTLRGFKEMLARSTVGVYVSSQPHASKNVCTFSHAGCLQTERRLSHYNFTSSLLNSSAATSQFYGRNRAWRSFKAAHPLTSTAKHGCCLKQPADRRSEACSLARWEDERKHQTDGCRKSTMPHDRLQQLQRGTSTRRGVRF